MESKHKSEGTTHITTVFGVNKTDTKHLFDDVRLATAVPPQPPNNHVTLPPTITKPAEVEEERMVRELVVKLPHITDGQHSNETSGTNSILGESRVSITSQSNSFQQRESRRHTSEFLFQAMPTAVCEVFQFSDGHVDNLKPSGGYQAAPLGKPHVKLTGRKARAVNRNSGTHEVELSENSANSRSLSATRRLTLSQTMKKYYKNQSVAYEPTKLPNINRDFSQLTTTTQRDTKSSPGKMSMSTDPMTSSLTNNTWGSSQERTTHSDTDWDEIRSKMATRGDSQWSWRSTQSMDNIKSSRTTTKADDESPWPGNAGSPNDDAAMSVTSDAEDNQKCGQDLRGSRNMEETLRIYHVTRSRGRRGQGAQNNIVDDVAPRSQHPIKSLPINTNQPDVEPEVISGQVKRGTILPPAIKVREAEKERRCQPNRTNTKTAGVGRPVADEENKMFEDSYYDQFSHRKLKKTVTPGERKRTRAQANNAISKQYERKDALQYIKVKIGRLGRESVEDEDPL